MCVVLHVYVCLCVRLELSGVRHKAKVRSLQDQLQTAEETRDTASMDRLKNVKLLTAEKGTHSYDTMLCMQLDGLMYVYTRFAGVEYIHH